MHGYRHSVGTGNHWSNTNRHSRWIQVIIGVTHVRWVQEIISKLHCVIVTKSTQDGPGGLMTSPLNEERVQEQEPYRTHTHEMIGIIVTCYLDKTRVCMCVHASVCSCNESVYCNATIKTTKRKKKTGKLICSSMPNWAQNKNKSTTSKM